MASILAEVRKLETASASGTGSFYGDRADSFATIPKHWRRVVVATAHGQDVRRVKTRGLSPWHRHADADEVFV